MSDVATIQTELRSALAHLNDPPYLERHPLTRILGFVAESSALSRGRMLRRTLKVAIEALDPGVDIPASASQARAYQVLYRYAISRKSMVAIALDLNISRRQAYRELRQSIEALAQILAEMDMTPGERGRVPPNSAAARAKRVRQELERLSSVASQDVDLVDLVRTAVASAQRLAEQRGVNIELHLRHQQLPVVVNRVMLRQAILNLLSHMARVHAGDTIHVALTCQDDDALLRCQYHPEIGNSLPSEGPHAIAMQLLQSLNIACEQTTLRDGSTVVVAHIPLPRQRTVLIVDDSEGTIALFRRYLRPLPILVYSATSGSEALAIMAASQPDIVILDVMMPGRDGWEVLEAIRAPGARSQPHVIICSVIDDPQLAAALGADAFLHKPVSRAQLLQVVTAASGNGS